MADVRSGEKKAEIKGRRRNYIYSMEIILALKRRSERRFKSGIKAAAEVGRMCAIRYATVLEQTDRGSVGGSDSKLSHLSTSCIHVIDRLVSRVRQTGNRYVLITVSFQFHEGLRTWKEVCRP